MSDAGKELVRRHFDEIWNERNLDACDELMAEDFTENAAAPFAPAAPRKVNGPSAMRGTVEWLVSQFPDIHMEIESIIAEGDIVAARILSTGANLGALDGAAPPTGKSFAARQSHWFRIANDRLAEHWATRDDLAAMVQLGVIQPPRTAPEIASADGFAAMRRRDRQSAIQRSTSATSAGRAARVASGFSLELRTPQGDPRCAVPHAVVRSCAARQSATSSTQPHRPSLYRNQPTLDRYPPA